MLTDIRGLMKDISDENSLIPVVKAGEVDDLIERRHRARRDDTQKCKAALWLCAAA